MEVMGGFSHMNDYKFVLINVYKNFLIDRLESHIVQHIVLTSQTSHDRTPPPWRTTPSQSSFCVVCVLTGPWSDS